MIPYPVTMLVYQPAWCAALARTHPWLLGWLLRRAPSETRQAVMWAYQFSLAYRLWTLQPARMVIA